MSDGVLASSSAVVPAVTPTGASAKESSGLLDGAAHLTGVEPYDPKYLSARIYLNANENPYGLPAELAQALAAELATLELHRYPDPLANELRQAIATHRGIAAEQVLVGNGGDELLLDLWMAYGGPRRRVVSCPPTFSVYSYNALLTFTELTELPRSSSAQLHWQIPFDDLLAAAELHDTSIIVIASPNNPTGECLELERLEQLLRSTSALVLLDQAYGEFAESRFDATSLLQRYANLAILGTFSKAYALAGMRIGYLLAAPAVLSELKKVRQPYSVNTLSARAATLALAHEQHYQAQISAIVAERQRLQDGLRQLGLTTAASQANFILFRVAQAHQLWQQLYDEFGILLRDFSASLGLRDCLRVTVGTAEENDQLLAALAQLLKDR